MASQSQDTVASANANTVSLPNLTVHDILLTVSTPTFLQLIRTSREFYDLALQTRPILLHHLRQIPGYKADLDDTSRSNAALFRLLRQRATNSLYGLNFTANLTEYLARNATLNPAACAISGLDADYVRSALVFKDSTDIRQFTGDGHVKEKIQQSPTMKVLKLVQWQRYISVLSAWKSPDPDSEPLDGEALDGLNSESEAEVLDETPFKPTASTQLTKQYHQHMDCKIGTAKQTKPISNKYNYRVCHYDIYTLEDSETFTVYGTLDLVPRDFCVYSITQCAILWDQDTAHGLPTERAMVFYYTAPRAELYYPFHYIGRKVWPKDKPRSRRGSNASESAATLEEEAPEHMAARIEFFKEGRRIKIYDAGGIVPCQVVSVSSNDFDRYASTNTIQFEDLTFNVDTPFYGTHAKYRVYGSQEMCFQTHLCLGTTTIDISDEHDWDEKEVRVLCILRSQTRYYPEDCDHRVNLQRMSHVSAGNATVVARLWGWEELHTNLTGKEVVAVSDGGTRIAIAMWKKVYIYALNPRILCDEVVVEDSDDEVSKKKKKKKTKKPWQCPASDYYHRMKDKNLLDWNIAELRPIVIDLDGAVAHRMSWSAPSGVITDTAVQTKEVNAEAEVSSEQSSVDTNVQTEGSASSEQTTMPAAPPVEAPETLPSSSTEVQPQSSTTQPIPASESSNLVQPNDDKPGEAVTSDEVEQAASATLPSMVQQEESAASTAQLTEADNNQSQTPINNNGSVAKSSARKKDKGPEVNITEMELGPKKATTYTEENSFVKLVALHSALAPSVSEQTASSGIPNSSSAIDSGLSASEEPVSAAPLPIVVADNEEVQSSSHSKATATPYPDERNETDEDENGESTQVDDKVDTSSKHKIRITEDELVILTDRGIQVWNLGAKAKGLRTKKALVMEEPLKGLLPRLKGKSKSMLQPEEEAEED
ncbi:hypothetical protein LTS08_005497 [Lithohypha guttulata]|nr:hypothetical protein LTS08_005497 [Lithohypha guttulata]